VSHVELESGASVLVNDTGMFHCSVSITGTDEQISNARLLLRMWYVRERLYVCVCVVLLGNRVWATCTFYLAIVFTV